MRRMRFFTILLRADAAPGPLDHPARAVASRGARSAWRLDAGPHLLRHLSGASLSGDTLAAFIASEVAHAGIAVNAVGFELAETAATTHFGNAVRGLGCRMALDDFGSGMASFAYLKSMRADRLKIDGSFVRTILGDPVDDPVDAAVVDAIARVSRVAGVQTIAEWVDDERVTSRLRELSIDCVQGFAVASPTALTPPSPGAVPASGA